MNVQTPEGHMITTMLHGLSVVKTFNTQQKSGALIVALGKDALFSLSYNGIPRTKLWRSPTSLLEGYPGHSSSKIAASPHEPGEPCWASRPARRRRFAVLRSDVANLLG